jgi:hypothetical protein
MGKANRKTCCAGREAINSQRKRDNAVAEEHDDEVGYGKPPKATQFQKGKSGNPRGRPRQNPGIAELFRKVSKQVVQANGPNGSQRMTKLEASITQLMNKATAGDLKAMKVLLQMASRFPELVKDPEGPTEISIKVVDMGEGWSEHKDD